MTALRVLAALHLNRLSSPPEDVEEVMDLLDEDTEINAHYVDPHKRTLLHIVLADEDPKCKETMREKLVCKPPTTSSPMHFGATFSAFSSSSKNVPRATLKRVNVPSSTFPKYNACAFGC
eukprot:jgi/Pico_ML_1/54238/g40.t1